MNFLDPQWTLLAGIILSQILPHNPRLLKNYRKLSSVILKFSVILLGASLNFHTVIKQGASGVLISFLSISLALMIGFIGFKVFKIEKDQGFLISIGTAICGGSAIGALAPVIRAKSVSIAVSMGVVFLFNALAVFIFPPIGHWVNLSQEQFGTWAALAIHDTSSVVAASSLYGDIALRVGTSIKLTRALWILPLIIVFGYRTRKEGKSKASSPPWFIGGFLLLSLLFTFIDVEPSLKGFVSSIAKLGFSATLFFIGLTFNRKMLKEVGLKPFTYGLSIWVIIALISLWGVQVFMT